MKDFETSVETELRETGSHDWNVGRLVQALSADASAGATLHLFMPSFAPNDTKKALVITSHAVTAVKRGFGAYKILWSVSMADVRSAEPSRSSFNGYYNDAVRIAGEGDPREFTFGFFNAQSQGNRCDMSQEMATNAALMIRRAAGLG